MLARSFTTATALGISEIERDALIATLFAFEREEITNFAMQVFRYECGTPACICGWANYLSNGAAFPELSDTGLMQYEMAGRLSSRLPAALFSGLFDIGYGRHGRATPSDAMKAISSYLTTGTASWS